MERLRKGAVRASTRIALMGGLPGRNEFGRPQAPDGQGEGQAIRLKHVRERAVSGDGLRVLVDRLWPRGVARESASVDLWLRDAAPSSALRRWFGNDAERWAEFQERYRAELERRPEILRLLADLRRRLPLTLLFGTRDEKHSNAIVLCDVLEHKEKCDESRRYHDHPGH